MDTKEIVQCALQIERSSADRSYGNILTLLGDLDKLQITAEQLETTAITQTLYRLLKTCSDGGVKKAAKSLLSKWKRRYGEDRRGVRAPEEGVAHERSCSVNEAGGGGVSKQGGASNVEEASSSSSGGKDGLQDASVRSKCVQLLLAALGPQPDPHKAADLARAVEERVHERHKSSGLRYKACVRSKVANLRNPKSKHLREGLLSGSLSAEAFARMSAEEMAGAELRRLREELSSRGVSERQLPQGVEGTQTHKVRCKRCGGSDCRVSQVSRGALFLPAWAKQGGPDQDAMTFVTCSGCGQQWYHSGWVCL